MDKNNCLGAVIERFKKLGLTYEVGSTADITIRTDFLDASWGSGKKTIHYEASILFDESSQTVYMYELTKESSSGFSYGSNSESSFQMGKTLFRKVKSVQYGPDGVAYEIDLDLGAIPKAAKESAKEYGWKFKTVMSRTKASYGPGHVHMEHEQQPEPVLQSEPILHSESVQLQKKSHFCPNCGVALSEPAKFCPSCGELLTKPVPQPVPTPTALTKTAVTPPPHKAKKFGLLNGLLFSLVALVALVFFALGGTTLMGKGIALAILILAFLLMKALKMKRAIGKFIYWALVFMLLVVVFGLTMIESEELLSKITYQIEDLKINMPSDIIPEGESIAVARVSETVTTPVIDGATVIGYEITMPESVDLAERVVEIEIPFDKSLLPVGGAEEAVIGALYFDESLSEWVPQTCHVDFERSVVTVYTDHFSKYAVAIFKDGRKKLTTTIPKYDYPSWNFTDGEIDKMVAEMESGEQQSPTALEKGWSQFNKYYGLTGATSTVIEAVAGGETLSNVNKLMNEAGMGFALGQLALDLYNGDTRAAKINFTKSSAFYAISKWGGNALGLASSGVTFIDLALTEFGEVALDKNLKKWEGAYNSYYVKDPNGRRTGDQWYKIIVDHYKTAKNSDEFKQKLEASVDEHTNKFWLDSEAVFSLADQAPRNAIFTAGGEYGKGVSDLRNNYKAQLYSTVIRNQMKVLEQRIWFKVIQKAEAKYDKLKAEMNKMYTVKVNLKNFANVKNPKLATFKLFNASGAVVHSQGFDANGNSGLSMTLLGFLKAGGPLKALIYVPASEGLPEFRTELPVILKNANVALSATYPHKEVVKNETTQKATQKVAEKSTEPLTKAPAPVKTTAAVKVFDQKAALGAWAADLAAEINARVYEEFDHTKTFRFEWVVAPYIKDGTIYGASRIEQTNTFHKGDNAGKSFTFYSNESYDANNHGPYISVYELEKKYPFYK